MVAPTPTPAQNQAKEMEAKIEAKNMEIRENERIIEDLAKCIYNISVQCSFDKIIEELEELEEKDELDEKDKEKLNKIDEVELLRDIFYAAKTKVKLENYIKALEILEKKFEERFKEYDEKWFSIHKSLSGVKDENERKRLEKEYDIAVDKMYASGKILAMIRAIKSEINEKLEDLDINMNKVIDMILMKKAIDYKEMRKLEKEAEEKDLDIELPEDEFEWKFSDIVLDDIREEFKEEDDMKKGDLSFMCIHDIVEPWDNLYWGFWTYMKFLGLSKD